MSIETRERERREEGRERREDGLGDEVWRGGTYRTLDETGSGGVHGLGFTEGRQKMFFLPFAHSDFIFAVIGEELGLMGALAVLGVFGIFALTPRQAGRIGRVHPMPAVHRTAAVAATRSPRRSSSRATSRIRCLPWRAHRNASRCG